jgi:hypothetical protein
MGKTFHGTKSPGHEYWSARPGNPRTPGKYNKKLTHKKERRIASREVFKEALGEEG